jgi:beta-xylosidase
VWNEPNLSGFWDGAVQKACFELYDLTAKTIKSIDLMGSPKGLTTAQIAHLNELTRDLPETDKIVRSGSGGTVDLSIPMNSNDIVLVKLKRSQGGK